MAPNARDFSSAGPGPAASPSQEYALLDFAERLDRHRAGRIAVHIHLSRLQSHNRREHHIRVAVSTFEDLVKQFQGHIFELANQDIVFLCKGVQVEELDRAILKLRYLFSEDPLSRFVDDNTEGGFCTWYVMERDYPRFLVMARRFHDISQVHRQGGDRLKRSAADARAPNNRRPLTPRQLAKMVELLENADLSPLVRRQPVCAVLPGQPPQPIFDEMYVSIGDLESRVLPDVSMTADPWLFKYLTQTLDKRMMAQVTRDSQHGDRGFSLNLNVATILSPEFQKLDQGIGLGVRGRLVIELQKVDIFADMGAYLFARDHLRERGYRICLDGLTHLTLPYIDRERLGLDLLKMYWSTELVNGLQPEAMAELEGQIRLAGLARIILTRCDTEAALEFGRSMGISLFQGRHVDQLLANERPPGQRLGSARFKP